MFQTHYRQKLDLTDEALAAAREGARRLGGFARRLAGARGTGDGPGFAAAVELLRRDFTAALDEDLNAPRAVAAVFDFVNEGNRLLDGGEAAGPIAWAAWQWVDGVLAAATEERVASVRADRSAATGTLSEVPPMDGAEVEAWAMAWAQARALAKARRDYPEADRIRNLLQENGFDVRDRKDGSIEVVRK
jgi:cysteinyl-tRNA synthetase